MKEPPIWFYKIPIWVWAMLLAGIILLIVFMSMTHNNSCPIKIKDVTDCNGLVESYEWCEKECKTGCEDLVPQIVDCYGQLLEDQLALENSTR